jgi:hypothetical protein
VGAGLPPPRLYRKKKKEKKKKLERQLKTEAVEESK